MLNSKFRVGKVFTLRNVIMGCSAASAIACEAVKQKPDRAKRILPLQSSTATEPTTASPIAATQTAVHTAVRHTDIPGSSLVALKGKATLGK